MFPSVRPPCLPGNCHFSPQIPFCRCHWLMSSDERLKISLQANERKDWCSAHSRTRKTPTPKIITFKVFCFCWMDNPGTTITSRHGQGQGQGLILTCGVFRSYRNWSIEKIRQEIFQVEKSISVIKTVNNFLSSKIQMILKTCFIHIWRPWVSLSVYQQAQRRPI